MSIMRQRAIVTISRSRRRGFSLIEVTVSILLVSVLLVTSLNSFAASKRREWATVTQAQGEQLALDLMNEILRQPYQDPIVQVPAFGTESGETTGNRSLFNDVDDYLNWTESPPADKSGNAMTGLSGWTRSVTIQWADPNSLTASISSSTGLKMITVTTSRSGKTAATAVGYRSSAWVDTIPTPTDVTGNHPPIASVNVNRFWGFAPLSVTFSATGSSDPDSDTLSYVWNFGDGSDGSGSTVTHSYTTSGTFNCVLTVYDGRGGVNTATQTIFVF